jgi:Cu2+-exporting ATPase
LAEVTAVAPDLLSAYVHDEGDGTAAMHLMVENMHCAGCVLRIESALQPLPGVVEARVNLTAKRLRLRWQPGEATADGLVARIAALGYRTVPFDPSEMASSRATEERALLRAVAVAGFAAANVMLLSVAVWAGAFEDMGPATRDLMHWVSALIALPAIAWAGQPFFRSAFAALRARAVNMDVPISVGVTLAAAASLWETAHGGAHAYFDAAVMLLFFLLIGRYLDTWSRGRARSAAERLAVMGAAAARMIEGGGERLVPARLLRPGMVVAVAPGDRIPADGRIESGATEIDTSLLTGETLPRVAKMGDQVFAGTVNLTGGLRVAVTAAGDDTVLAEIVRLMEAAESRRGRYVRLADRAARLYAPLVHGAALATFLGWTVLAGSAWQPALMIAVSVLIITCPCALGLAVPAAQVAAAGRLLRGGILVKQPDALERLAAVDTVVFDKTGTLTEGRPRLRDDSARDPAALALAARLAAASRHPLCRALVAAAGSATPLPEVVETPGYGLAAGRWRLGSRVWCGVPDKGLGDTARGPELWLARPDAPPVRFAFEDEARPDAARAIATLRAMGLSISLLSGDRTDAVRILAAKVGIADWRADCRPSDKVAILEGLTAQGRKVLMVGDGLNDAPALAAAFVSLSPAAAADVSRAAADLVFQGESLMAAAEAVDTARRARRVMMQNLIGAAGYNLLAVPIAVVGLATPLVAAAAMSASSILVTVNAMRLGRRRRQAS